MHVRTMAADKENAAANAEGEKKKTKEEKEKEGQMSEEDLKEKEELEACVRRRVGNGAIQDHLLLSN